MYSGKRDVADLQPDAVGDGARDRDRQVVGLLMSRLRRMAVMIDQLSLARQSRNVEAMQLDAASHAVHWAIIELEGLECNAKIEPAWRAPCAAIGTPRGGIHPVRGINVTDRRHCLLRGSNGPVIFKGTLTAFNAST